MVINIFKRKTWVASLSLLFVTPFSYATLSCPNGSVCSGAGDNVNESNRAGELKIENLTLTGRSGTLAVVQMGNYFAGRGYQNPKIEATNLKINTNLGTSTPDRGVLTGSGQANTNITTIVKDSEIKMSTYSYG